MTADLYPLPDSTTPWKSDAEMMAHVGSWRYQNDSAFREACEMKSAAFGVPGTTVMQAKEYSGQHRVVTAAVEQAEAAEAAQSNLSSLTIGGVSRVSFSPLDTEKALGEAARRAQAADKQQQE